MLELALIIDLILGRWVEATVIAALLLFSHSGPLHPAWKYVPVRAGTPRHTLLFVSPFPASLSMWSPWRDDGYRTRGWEPAWTVAGRRVWSAIC